MDAYVVLFLVIVIICWACYRRKLEKAAYGIAALDLGLRLFDVVSRNIGKNEVATFLAKWPNSLMSVADQYTKGLINVIISWMFVLLMIYFLFLIIRVFFKK